MLQELHVKNFALIDDVEVELHDGLNILSGETGAGKSIIMGSVNMALGGKTSREFIRHGCSYAYVELSFKITNSSQRQRLEELDIIPDEDDMIVISRKITDTKSVSRINGENVNLSVMRDVAAILIDIHGQKDNQLLTTPKKQLAMLDSFAGGELESVLGEYQQIYGKYQEIMKALNSVEMDDAQRMREMSYLEFVIQEIEEARLSVDEEQELMAAFKKMSHARQLEEGLSRVQERLQGKHYGTMEIGISDAVSDSIHDIGKLMSDLPEDAGLARIHDMLMDMESIANDLSHEISGYCDELDSNEEEYVRVQERLDLIHEMKNKYGRTVRDVLAFCEKQKEQLAGLQNYEAAQEENLKQKELYFEQLVALGKKLHDIRCRTAKTLSVQVLDALKDLNFLNTEFQIEVLAEDETHFMQMGTDSVTFLISPNAGEQLKPVSEIASGGELSRIMLALKAVLASADDIETFVFDEIDAGISGRTAQMVSEKLDAISKAHQIICISHLPQIVSMADYHYLIEKHTNGNETKTEIVQLDYEESVNEIARLLGGSQITQTVLDSAWEMKDLAQKSKYC